MSMYGLLFGRNPYAALLLAMLGLSVEDTGRFRDAFAVDDCGEIAIYTRNGGGNREDQAEAIERMRVHPNYLKDKDDDFDCTYATFYFTCPNQYRPTLALLNSGSFDPDKRWHDKLEEAEAMSSEELKTAYPQLVKQLEEVVKAVKD